MKSKNFKQKLALNKKTIVNLGKTTMGKVYGGMPIATMDIEESVCICDRVALHPSECHSCPC